MAKLTKEITKKICDLIEAGNFINAVCGHVGISEPTFYGWYNLGKEAGKGKHYDFYMAVETAKAAGEVKVVEGIVEAGKKDWRAAAWFLSRRYKERWGDKPTVVEAHGSFDVDGFKAKISARVASEVAETMAIFEPTIDLSTLNDDQLEKYETFIKSLDYEAVVTLPTNGRG